MDFAIWLTGEAIEEVDSRAIGDMGELAFVSYNSELLEKGCANAPLQDSPKQAFIIRTVYDPTSTPLRDYAGDKLEGGRDDVLESSLLGLTLTQALESFASVLSQRLGHKVGFIYAISHRPNQDWIALYQASVMPVECGKYYIRPSWYPPKEACENIVIDPALAFGSGHHASTFVCVELLSSLELAGKFCLDVGCGSGILGIIMAKQGGIVDACDVDCLAVEETQKNFSRNALGARVIKQGSLVDMLGESKEFQHRYDVVCANIVADVLACMHDDFLAALKPCGILILSGILSEKCEWILEIFHDMRLLQREQRDEWVSLKFAVDSRNITQNIL